MYHRLRKETYFRDAEVGSLRSVIQQWLWYIRNMNQSDLARLLVLFLNVLVQGSANFIYTARRRVLPRKTLAERAR
jgi:hypothetical protein